MRFKEKVAIITGAASGMGLAAAELLAAEGAILAINDVNADKLDEVTKSLSGAGRTVVAIPGDIANHEFVERATASVISRFKKVDILLNVAGCASHGPAESYDSWDRILSVDLNGAYYFARSVAKLSMIPNRSGSVVNVSSLAGLVAHPFDVGYVAAKHGLVGVTKALAVEWARFNIRVNCVCPGYVRTAIIAAVEKRAPEKFKTRARHVPLGRAGEPNELAAAMGFLASDDASYITGLIMPVDGGQMALSSGWMAPEIEHLG
jgi:NAD(P)-dependent dehydrogenase (short-subunit alcohol dehydrogenase family)